MLGTAMAFNAFIQPDGCLDEKRDPCASPPCKRLKQAKLPVECIIIDGGTETANQEHVSECQGQENNKQNICAETKNLMETEILLEDGSKSETQPDPPLSMDELQETKTVAQNLNCVNGSLKNSTDVVRCSNDKSQSLLKPTTNHLDASQSPKESAALLKFFKPVSPSSKVSSADDAEHSKTPSKDGNETSNETPLKDGRSCTPVNTKTSPDGDGTSMVINLETPSPGNVLSSNTKTTPRRETPGRKLSVEEKLKREDERLRRRKEKEALEQERLEKKKERERAREEKQKERMEAKQKKEQEKLEQLEQKKQREKERIEKKEKEEREKKERLEKKEEEKRKREEEKKKREDEKNSKNEEKRKKEEEEMLKKQKAKNSFASFFIKKEVAASQKPKEQVPRETKFQPFELKPCMKLASAPYRKPLSDSDKQQLCKHLVEQGTATLLHVKEELIALRELARQIKLEEDESKMNSTVERDEDDDIMIIDDDMIIDGDISSSLKTTETTTQHEISKIKGKLLQFHENYRPAYFGSWRKRSSSVQARTPLKKDEDILNYDIDSDDEWEEEEPGESLSNSEGEDEEDGCPNDDDEEQDGFFVPHGYLSDDEGDGNDEETTMEHNGAHTEKSSKDNTDDKMERHLVKQKTWEAELKRQFKPMKPIAIGCIWDGEIPSILKQLEGCSFLSEESIDPTCMKEETVVVPSTTSYCNTAMPVPEEAMPFLIQMIHCNEAGLQKLIRLFRKQWTLKTKKEEHVSEENWQSHCTVSKRQVEKKITSIANKELRSSLPKSRWYVHSKILAFYNLENIAGNGLACANSEKSSPVPPPRAKSPILASLANIKNSFEKRTKELSQTVQNTEGTSMDTTPTVRLEK